MSTNLDTESEIYYSSDDEEYCQALNNPNAEIVLTSRGYKIYYEYLDNGIDDNMPVSDQVFEDFIGDTSIMIEDYLKDMSLPIGEYYTISDFTECVERHTEYDSLKMFREFTEKESEETE